MKKFRQAKLVPKPTLKNEIAALKRMAQKKQNKRQIVHLGNVGDIRIIPIHGRKIRVSAAKTFDYATRFKNVQFTGIDIAPLYRETPKKLERLKRGFFRILGIKTPNMFKLKPKNWVQFQKEFNSGLRKLENNSCDIISSEMALGYYSKSNRIGGKIVNKDRLYRDSLLEYELDTIKLCRQKLKPNGKLMVAVSGDVLDAIKKGFEEAGFSGKKIQIKKIEKTKRTRWFKSGTFFSYAPKINLGFSGGQHFYQIVAVN